MVPGPAVQERLTPTVRTEAWGPAADLTEQRRAGTPPPPSRKPHRPGDWGVCEAGSTLPLSRRRPGPPLRPAAAMTYLRIEVRPAPGDRVVSLCSLLQDRHSPSQLWVWGLATGLLFLRSYFESSNFL